MLREIESKLVEEIGLAPADHSATANGAAVDLQDRCAATAIFNTGVLTTVDGSNFFTLVIEDSDDGSTGWAVSDTAAVLGASDGGKVFKSKYSGNKRYIRCSVVETGASVAIIGAVVVSASLFQPEA